MLERRGVQLPKEESGGISRGEKLLRNLYCILKAMEYQKDFKQIISMTRYALEKDYSDFSVENSVKADLMGECLGIGLLFGG